MSSEYYQSTLPIRDDTHPVGVRRTDRPTYRARCNECNWQSYTTVEQRAKDAAQQHRMRAQHPTRVEQVTYHMGDL